MKLPSLFFDCPDKHYLDFTEEKIKFGRLCTPERLNALLKEMGLAIGEYIAMNGRIEEYDADSTIELVEGESAMRSGWRAIIFYVPSTKSFVEFRCAGSLNEEEEVEESYIRTTFGITAEQIGAFKSRQKSKFLVTE